MLYIDYHVMISNVIVYDFLLIIIWQARRKEESEAEGSVAVDINTDSGGVLMRFNYSGR